MENHFTTHEAKEQLDRIEKIIMSTTHLNISGSRLIILGVFFLLTPWIQWGIENSLWKMSIFQNTMGSILGNLANILIYYAIFYLLFRLGGKKKSTSTPLNPMIKNIFDIHKVLIYLMIIMVVILSIRGEGEWIMVFIFCFLGILFNLIGRLTQARIIGLSYSFFMVSIGYLIFPNLSWVAGMFYLGAAYVVMGMWLHRRWEK